MLIGEFFPSSRVDCFASVASSRGRFDLAGTRDFNS